jgi:hypothetical protein
MTSTYLDPVFNSFKSLCSQFGSLETVWCDPVGAGGATCYVMRFTLKKTRGDLASGDTSEDLRQVRI